MRNFLNRLKYFIILAALQTLLFGHIHLFGYATVYIYLLFILKMPRFATRNEQMMWAFALGLTVDIFGNTPGINACAATAMEFARGYILESFTQKGVADNFVPGIHTINVAGYIMYATLCLLLFYTVLFLLELFTIHYPLTLLASIAASTLLTLLFTLVIECFTRKK